MRSGAADDNADCAKCAARAGDAQCNVFRPPANWGLRESTARRCEPRAEAVQVAVQLPPAEQAGVGWACALRWRSHGSRAFALFEFVPSHGFL